MRFNVERSEDRKDEEILVDLLYLNTYHCKDRSREGKQKIVNFSENTFIIT